MDDMKISDGAMEAAGQAICLNRYGGLHCCKTGAGVMCEARYEIRGEGRDAIAAVLTYYAAHPDELPQEVRDAVKGRSHQKRLSEWVVACFGEEIARDKVERCDRFTEESLELVQSLNMPKDRVLALVDYVYGREKGDPFQEVGGVRNTLAALCAACGLDADAAAEAELARVWTLIDKIRQKQASKPVGSALPQ